MTDQEVYEQTKAWLTRPGGARAYDENQGMCMYRTPDGNKCAVGCLIPDEEYNTDMEGVGVQTLVMEHSLPTLNGASTELLADLQSIHDTFQYWDEDGLAWVGVQRLDQVARDHGLVVV